MRWISIEIFTYKDYLKYKHIFEEKWVKEGKKDTLREIAIKMLKKNLTEKEITEITGISKKELNNLKLTNNYK